MKIEKVNDHQIRCTLTKADLADRELKISELAYGTEKAKSDPAQCRLHRFSNHQSGRSGGARHALFQICSRNGG